MLAMRAFALLACFSLLCLAPPSAFAGQQPWIEATSPHFRVLTDGTAHDAREVATEFEQMRYVFATGFPAFRLDSGAPLTIFAAEDLQSAKRLEPREAKRWENLAGEYQHGWEKQYAIVRMDAWGQGAHQSVYHEYVHSILHLNARWLPAWLDEGTAEFYAYTRFQSGKIYIGAPTERFATLRRMAPMPVERLIEVTHDSPEYTDPAKAELFYADSWALVHYLNFSQKLKGGLMFKQFYALLQKGVPQKEAFVQVFGDFAAFNKDWYNYANLQAYAAAVLPPAPKLEKESIAERKLTVAQTEYELGAFHIATFDRENGEHLIDAALRDDPNLGPAHEEKGYLLLSKGQDAQAVAEFAQAFTLDPTLYRSLFAKTMLSAPGPETRAALDQVISLAPKFAPALIARAQLEFREHNNSAAFADARKAEALEPSRAGYHLLTGRILLALGQPAQAAEFARFVADRWRGPDRDEALALWNEVPAAKRPAGVTLAEEPFLEHAQTVAGTIEGTHCGSATEPFTLQLATASGSKTFYQQHGFATGFSDTLWYGEDHFNFCHHLENRQAVVFFRPSSDANYAGVLAMVEIRDSLDAPQAVASTAATASAAAGPQP